MEEQEQTPPQSSYRPAQIVWSVLQMLLGWSLILATLFTLFTPANLFSNQYFDQMFQTAAQTTGTEPTSAAPIQLSVGIVPGHYGNDSGAVCPDGLTEVSINLDIASRVQSALIAKGFQVEILKEFDPNLEGFAAKALISIHNDSCDYVNDQATGFKVAATSSEQSGTNSNRLRDCLVYHYGSVTGLPFHQGSITSDMSSYHSFSEIDQRTTAVIIETGFMNLDRDILTNRPDVVSEGITRGILCYLQNEPIPQE